MKYLNGGLQSLHSISMGAKRRQLKEADFHAQAWSHTLVDYSKYTAFFKTQCRSTTACLHKMSPSPISSPSSATGQISLLGSLQTLGRLGLLLVLEVTRLLELTRTFLLPRSGGETVRAISARLGEAGDGTSCSMLLGLRRKHRSSILSIHLLSFTVGDVAAAAAEKRVKELRRYGDSERERFSFSISAARWLLTNTSRSSAGEMKYANGS